MISEHDFTYCPQCSSRFSTTEENLLICPGCDLHYYINPKPTNAIILENENGEILFVKRSIEPQKGYLDLPGGFVDLHETLEASLYRELQEELQIKLETFHYIGSMVDRYAYQGISYHTVCALFLGHISKDTKITPSDDADECVFIAKNKIPYDKIAFDGIKEALKKYVEAVR